MTDLDINALNLDEARQMLEHECSLRKSDEVQKMYTLIQTGQINDLELIEDYVQYMTIGKFDYSQTKNSLKNYRLIYAKFGSDVVSSAFYLKYNIMAEPLLPGNLVNISDMDLIRYSDRVCVKFDELCDKRPTLIFSGSIT
jgi:hypothetical protein